MEIFPQPVLHYNLAMLSQKTYRNMITAGLVLAFTVSLASCNSRATETPDVQPQAPSHTPQATATITPTPEPLALTVNGQGVPLAEYEAQLLQLTAADEQTGKQRTPEEQRQMVLDELINQTLLAQAAWENGFDLDEMALQTRIDELTAEIGGQTALEAWLTANGYSPDSFRGALKRGAASAWQRDEIIGKVPVSTEQVRVQQILVRDSAVAEDLHAQLEAGADFATLAMRYDPITGGILGWFPRGYLTQPAVEEAAFALQPGEYSQVVETDFGFHIVYVLERDRDRELSVDARTALQHKVLAAWLEDQRNASNIEILVP